MPDEATLNDNAAVTARLQALVSRLSDADLGRDLGGGWTVAVALSHLAFWDRRIAYMLERWMEDGTPHVELDDDVVNKGAGGGAPGGGTASGGAPRGGVGQGGRCGDRANAGCDRESADRGGPRVSAAADGASHRAHRADRGGAELSCLAPTNA